MPSRLPERRSRNSRLIATLSTASIIAAAIVINASATLAEEPVAIDQDNTLRPIPEKVVEAKQTKEWKIQIVPGPSSVVSQSVVRPSTHIEQVSFNQVVQDTAEKNLVPPVEERSPAACHLEHRQITPESYREIYNSIPFSRAEYLANRDYRHEATMEILFGQLRPKTIVKTAAPATETRTSYTHQSFGRPGSIPGPVLNTPLIWGSWAW